MRGFRGRLIATIVGLVTLTSIVLSAAAYALVASSLRDQQRDEAIAQANFVVAVLADERLGDAPSRDDVLASGLLEAISLRGVLGAVIDLRDGDPIGSGFGPVAAHARLSDGLLSIVARGNIGYERLDVEGRPALVAGARLPPDGPDIYLFLDAAPVEDAIGQLGQALLAGSLVLVAVALLVGGAVARGVLLPVRDAGIAAERIAAGDLSTRLDPGGTDEFAAWTASFNRMAASLAETVDDLRRAEDRQRAFVADVSHELRTPLTALVQEADYLRAHLGLLPPDARRAAELLVGDVGRLRTLVDDLMEISRFDAAAEAVRVEAFDVGRFVEAVVAARAPGGRLSTPPAGMVVTTDRRRLERILANLLDNARQHAPRSPVEVRATVADGELGLVVADRGPGVPAEALPSLFERFTKADPSRAGGGSGLGLALARAHVELLGGSIEARLREGGGLAVVVRIPVTRPLPGGDDRDTEEVHRAGDG
ncbi:MAG TPA: HAMP domain-containing sensor histidine kinase [Patescibacteria group bacterium]|nr:HAMP domain-containing sensor histidine kinase [Patescibacteria group bacterium]